MGYEKFCTISNLVKVCDDDVSDDCGIIQVDPKKLSVGYSSPALPMNCIKMQQQGEAKVL